MLKKLGVFTAGIMGFATSLFFQYGLAIYFSRNPIYAGLNLQTYVLLFNLSALPVLLWYLYRIAKEYSPLTFMDIRASDKALLVGCYAGLNLFLLSFRLLSEEKNI